MSGVIGPGRVEVPAESIGNRLSPGRPDANGKGDVCDDRKDHGLGGRCIFN